MELCGRGRTIPEPDCSGQSVSSAPICLRPPITPPSMGCRPGTGLAPNWARFEADSGPMSAYCATESCYLVLVQDRVGLIVTYIELIFSPIVATIPACLQYFMN
jgi:hypothetical protein